MSDVVGRARALHASGRGVAVILVGLLLLVTTPSTGATAAAPSSADQDQRRVEVARELESLQRQLHEADAEEAQLIAELRVATSRERKLDAILTALDARVLAARADLDLAQAAFDDADARYQETARRTALMKSRMLQAKSILEEQAVTAFMYYGNDSGRQLQRFVETSSWRELHEVSAFLDVVAEQQGKVIETYRGLRDQAEEAQATEESARDAARSLRDDVASRTDAIEAVRTEQRRSGREAEREAEEQRRLIALLRERQNAFETRMAALKRESASISELLRRRQAGRQPTSVGVGVLGWPLTTVRITSEFGPRVHPIYGTERMHDGLDFGADVGIPILAAADGVVVSAGERGGYGNTVLVDHGGSLSTLYAHQSTMAVGMGDPVKRGQVIGYVGSTGFSTGPHLHFEVRVNGAPVDPMPYL
ncbi:MAG: peptidoglycan DD-metalloendopeptidase family protein [Actinobacteria bacterium]|nr:peptidoglycan DD-metalloendopeptidase family protein [Actinomycetota bacterium]MBI3257698.1 peptidoglycan DD-metalloendopeptidase family protein [Actinomycetota bacterium]